MLGFLHNVKLFQVIVLLMMLRIIIFFTIFTLPVLMTAQTEDLQSFLAATHAYPGYRASQSFLEGAKAALREAYNRVEVDADIGYTVQRGTPDNPRGLTDGGILGDAGISFRPLLYGPDADLARRRELDLRLAVLTHQERLIALESRAIRAAGSAALAQTSVTLARELLSVAEQDLNTVRLRFDAGLITDQEVRAAELAAQAAQARLRDAEAEASIAEMSLSNLVGDARLAALPDLALPEGEAAAVTRARANVEYERIALTSLRQTFYPVARASYEYSLGESTALVASVESDTLEPRIGIKFNDYGLDSTSTSLEVGVGINLSLGMFDALKGAESRLETAQLDLAATLQDGAIAAERLRLAAQSADEALELAGRRLESATQTLATAQERERLGLSLPLDTQRAATNLIQARYDLEAAQLRKQEAQLAFYELYAVPLSEVTP